MSKTKAFTLIEIMVVISIVTLLSSVVSVSLVDARRKGDDAKKKIEVSSVEKAITLQKDSTGLVPQNYTSGGNGIATEGTTEFNASMQELVNNKFLSSIPRSPDGSYVYYASNTANTAAFGAPLKTVGIVPDPNKSSCSGVPSSVPYTSCILYSQPPDTQTIDTATTETLCRLYGPNNICYPDATNQIPGLRCTGKVKTDVYKNTYCDFGPPVVRFNYCFPNTNIATVSTCSGGSADFCACVGN